LAGKQAAGRPAQIEGELTVAEANILRHISHSVDAERDETRIGVFDAQVRPLPTWPLDAFYLANIGGPDDPLFFELRFARLSEDSEATQVALLMTTERGYQIRHLAQRMIEVVEDGGVRFDAAFGIPALGVPLAQAMCDLRGPGFFWTTCQKGRSDEAMPKGWLDSKCSCSYHSGTKPYEQVLYLDPILASYLKDREIIVTDDARLTGGSINATVALLQQLDLPLVAVVSVLNEADPITEIQGPKYAVPYFSLAKIPVFTKDARGFHPNEGTFDGVDSFFIERS
jgi:adenine/guanine phosphoribosyltransferase-like PRPP-binding protein